MEKEIWKTIEDFPNYKISNYGIVRSIDRTSRRGVLIKSQRMKELTNHGYKYVCLRKITEEGKQFQKQLAVHRLLCDLFIPNPENKPQVNHKNGIKTDNRLENLEWATPLENVRHSIETGLKTFPLGSKSFNGKLSSEDVRYIRNNYERGKTTYKEIAVKFKVCSNVIGQIIRGETYVNE